MSNKVVIKFESFSFCYQNLMEASLKNINLEIYAGEKILIAGRSGSGKSTLLHCINGLIPFANYGEITGKLTIDGIPDRVSGIFDISNQVGTILQDQDAQFIGLTVGEDVAFVLENNTATNETMKMVVPECLAKVGMHTYIDYSPYELSGGQKQRVSLAGILAYAPNILLFDEPLASLDPASSDNAVQLINNINKDEGKTIIIAEHRLEEILEAELDRIVIMDQGRIIFIGSPIEVLSSQILEQTGIRVPLYVEAIKFSAPNPEIIDNHKNINQLSDGSILALNNWVNKIQLPQSVKNSVTKNVLTLKDISFAYTPEKPILNNISFSIHAGEMVSILGNNGAGKSTLTYIICGFLRPDNGTILLNEQDITSSTIKQRGEKIGLVMQDHNSMLIKSTVKDEIALGLKSKNLNQSIIDEKIEQVLRICNLWGYRNWPTVALSYGQKKRVTIASMLVLDPKVLILDEPTAGQDFRTYHEFMEFLNQLATTGIAILIITHDLYLAMEYTSRSIVLASGKKIADNTPAQIFANTEYLNAANLREISLSKLAKKSGINIDTFIQKFIFYKKEFT